MKYYNLKCEVPGGLGNETTYQKDSIPWTISNLHVIFEGWLGGHILAISSELIATEALCNMLEFKYFGIESYDTFKLEISNNCKILQPNLELPSFKRLIVGTKLFKDDIAIGQYNNLYNQLIISEKIKLILDKFNLGNYSIELAEQDNQPT